MKDVVDFRVNRGDSLAREPVPHGYRVRLNLSHHLGGWKPCVGLPKCEHCAGLARARQSIARREGRNRRLELEESAITAFNLRGDRKATDAPESRSESLAA